MEQQYGDDIITITDEDGVEYELEVLARIAYGDAEYLALTPADAQEAEEMEVSILKAVEEDGEEILVAVEDDQELESVYSALMDQLYEEEAEDGEA